VLRLLAALALVGAMAAPSVHGGVGWSLVVTPSSGVAGATLSATASGFETGTTVTLWWDKTSVLLGTQTANDAFQATFKFKIPDGAPLGAHTVRACGSSLCNDGTQAPYADDVVNVVLPATPKPTSTPRPTRAPTPRPTVAATPESSGGVAIPIPSFPLAGPSAAPTLPAYVAITPAPEPPNDIVGPETEWPNLWVAGLEVTQGVQNLDNEMPLVAGRRTYVRVYVGLSGAQTWPHTWGALEARRAGQHIGWIWPENGPIVAKAGGGDRVNLDDSLYFRLPANWLTGGVTLTTFVFSYGIDTPFTKEPLALDNTWQESVYFNEALPLTLHLAPLHMHRSWHPSDVERVFTVPDLGGVIAPGADLSAIGVTNRVVAGVHRYLPIAQVNLDTLNAPVFPLNHFDGHEFDLGGPCRTVLLESPASNHVELADWTVLVKDPSVVTPGGGAGVQPDRGELRIMDWKFTIDYFYAREDGTASVFGSSDLAGPWPVPGAPVYAYGCGQIVGADAEPNHAMGLYRVFYDWQDEREMFVGMVHPSLRSQWGGFSTPSTDSVWVKWTDEYGEDDPWRHGGAGILGHEASHGAGYGHVPCKDDNGDGIPDEAGDWFDLTHPMTLTFPDCKLSEVDPEGYYGFDTAWDRFGLDGPTVLSNDPAQALPNRAFPLLSYKQPGWSDPYHYCRLLSYYGVPCNPTAIGIPWNVPPPEPDGSDPFAAVTPPPAPLGDGIDSMSISFTGLEDGTWTLDVLARNPSPTANDAERIAAERRAKPDPARDWIVVLDGSGAVQWQAILPGASAPHEAEGGATIGDAIVPVWPDTTAVEIRGWDARTKARAESSEGVPEVAGMFRDTAEGESLEPGDEIVVRFEARDPDGDRLHYFLLYAPDRRHWQLAGASDAPQIRVQVDDLPSGDEPTFKLVAFDGWNVDEEEMPVPELAGPRNPPNVLILASGPRRYPLQALVRVEASAFDVEDRALPGESIRWSSSIDGDLGTGSELATRALSAGRHVITASATDSDGLEGSATYELEVDASVVEPLPGADMQERMAEIFERLGAGLDPAPSASETGHPEFLWIPIGITATLAAIVLLLGLRFWKTRRPPTG